MATKIILLSIAKAQTDINLPENSKDPSTVLSEILTNFLLFAGIFAVLAFVVGGYQIISSSGDPTKVERGKKTITAAVIGIILIMLGRIIINTIFDCVSTFGKCI